MRDDLTAEQLFARVTKGIRFGSSVFGNSRAALRAGNIDLLRCLDEFLHGDNLKQYNLISRTQSIFQNEMSREASGLLTQAMLDITDRVYAARVYASPDDRHYTHTRHKFCAYAFDNMDKIDGIMFLLEERGMIDVNEVENALNEISFSNLAKPILEGVL
jgi:hypothetical protein